MWHLFLHLTKGTWGSNTLWRMVITSQWRSNGETVYKVWCSVCLFCISLGGGVMIAAWQVWAVVQCVCGRPISVDRLVLAFFREVPSSSTGQTRELFQSLKPAKSLPWLLIVPLSFLRLQPTIPLLQPSLLLLFWLLSWTVQLPPVVMAIGAASTIEKTASSPFHCCCQSLALQPCLGHSCHCWWMPCCFCSLTC